MALNALNKAELIFRDNLKAQLISKGRVWLLVSQRVKTAAPIKMTGQKSAELTGQHHLNVDSTLSLRRSRPMTKSSFNHDEAAQLKCSISANDAW